MVETPPMGAPGTGARRFAPPPHFSPRAPSFDSCPELVCARPRTSMFPSVGGCRRISLLGPMGDWFGVEGGSEVCCGYRLLPQMPSAAAPAAGAESLEEVFRQSLPQWDRPPSWGVGGGGTAPTATNYDIFFLRWLHL